jgi:hypothetical protein
MQNIENKFDYHTEINTSDLYKVVVDSIDVSKVVKAIKYITKRNDMLLHTTQGDKIVVLMIGALPPVESNLMVVSHTKITKEEAIMMVNIGGKYRFLGKFYKQVPKVEFAGMTQEEIDELAKVKAPVSDKCNCGDLWEDHTIRKTVSAHEFDVYIIAEDHYEEQHKEFKKIHIRNYSSKLN